MRTLPPTACLPQDLSTALLAGRVWRAAPVDGPSVVIVRYGQVFDITAAAPTMSDLLDRPDLLAFVRTVQGEPLGSAEALVAGTLAHHAGLANATAYLLAPCDLQAIKACGVTFAVSLLERVIEEQAGGRPARAAALRAELLAAIGADLSSIKPGSEQAAQLKHEFQARGIWSQYMEVGIGPYAEVFSKSQPMSAVGLGADVGLHPASQWNNPEPEVVLAVNSRFQAVGAALGNDVNLRDIEGRSALLLGKAKDNNASCAIGPFIRLFDDGFTLDHVRQAEVALSIEGADDGFVLEGVNKMRQISRDPLELIAQTAGAHHQYPDGFMLFLGTMFSPIQDRGAPGAVFTHRLGDRVTIGSPALGRLLNHVQRSDQLPPWTFGARALFRNLTRRGIAAGA